MSLESNPMYIVEMLEVIKESAVECKDISDNPCVCLTDITLDSLLYVINSAEDVLIKTGGAYMGGNAE